MDHEIGGVATGLTTCEISVAYSMKPSTAMYSVGTEMACAMLFEQAAREFNEYESVRAHLRDRCDGKMRHSLACIYNSPIR